MLKKGKTLLLVLLTLFMVGSEVNVYVSAEETQDTDVEETTESSTKETRSGASYTYDDPYTSGSYTVYEITASDYSSATEAGAALDYLIESVISPTSSKPVKVIVNSGTYTKAAGNSLYIPSYTWLYFKNGVTLNQEAQEDPGTLIRIGDSPSTASGYCYKNIIIEGQSASSVTFSKNGVDDTLIQIGHADGVTVKNITFNNIHNGHFIEIAGSKNVTVSGCTFKNATLDSAAVATFEAIQIDILQSTHFSGYKTEDLANKTITVTGCTFSNCIRGVGSHTAMLNNPTDGLTITNNTFTNLKSCAVELMDVKNTTISGNTVTGTPRGIFIYTYKSTNCFKSTTLKSGSSISTKYVTPTSRNIVIKSNTISLSGTDSYAGSTGAYTNRGIMISGMDLTSYTLSSGDKMPSGNYYITGVTVSNNTITTNGHGIQLSDCRGTTVSGNTITYSGSAYKSSTGANKYFGLYVSDASAGTITISGNTTKNSSNKFCYGVFVTGSTITTLSNNKIASTADHGIFIYSSSKVTTISGNTVSSPGTNGIMVYSSSTVTNIKSNTISSSGKYGISITTKSTATKISSNTLKSCKNYGIDIQSIKNNLTISSNTITSNTGYSIRLYPQNTSYKITVKSNKITGKSKKYAGIYASKAYVTIQSNTIKSCSDAVYLTTSTKGSIYTNTLSSNKYNKYRIGSKRYSKPGTPTLTISTKKKTSIKLKWTKKGSSGYQIYRSKSKSGTYTKVKTISKASTKTYTNTGLKKSTTYYYKIRAKTKASNANITIYGSYSSIKSGKTKSK